MNSISACIQQVGLGVSLFSLGKFLGSRVEILKFLNIPGEPKNLVISAIVTNAIFKMIDFVVKQTTFRLHQWLPITLSAMGSYGMAQALSVRGFLPEHYKVHFVLLSTLIHLFTENESDPMLFVQQRERAIQTRVAQYMTTPEAQEKINQGIHNRINELVANENIQPHVDRAITELAHRQALEADITDKVAEEIQKRVQNQITEKEVTKAVKNYIANNVKEWVDVYLKNNDTTIEHMAKSKLDENVNQAYDQILLNTLTMHKLSTIDDYAQLAFEEEIERIQKFYLETKNCHTIEQVASKQFHQNVEKALKELGDPMTEARKQFNLNVEGAKKLLTPSSPLSREGSRTRSIQPTSVEIVAKKLNLEEQPLDSSPVKPQPHKSASETSSSSSNDSSNEDSTKGLTGDLSSLVNAAKTLSFPFIAENSNQETVIEKQPDEH